MPEGDMWSMNWFVCYACNREDETHVPCMFMISRPETSEENPDADTAYMEQVEYYEGDLKCPYRSSEEADSIKAQFFPVTIQQVIMIITDNKRSLVKKSRDPEKTDKVVNTLKDRFSDLEVV